MLGQTGHVLSIFLICHKDLPYFTPPEGATIMWMRPKRPLVLKRYNFIMGYDYFTNPEDLHKKFSGTLGSMAVQKHLLQTAHRPNLVTIWQYRKFVTKNAYGVEAKNYEGMRIISPKSPVLENLEDPEIRLKTIKLNSDHERFLVSIPLLVKNMAFQYQSSHHVIDLFRFTSVALEVGAITQKEALEFFNAPYIVPGGLELGTYPTEWWLTEFGRLTVATSTYSEKYSPYQPDDVYQMRAASFLAERLGSYFLMRHARRIYGNQNIPLDRFGNLHNVDEGNGYSPGV